MSRTLDHSDEDAARVRSQLGRHPRGRWAVARRCHLGIPMVIESHPRLDDGSPFPTLFWLTCPLLVKRASKLEAAGFMRELTERLAADSSLHARVEAGLARYVARRDALEVLPPSSPAGGGPDRIKCLHAHLAHELTDPPNAAGGITLAATGWPDCVAPCIASPE